MSPCTDKPSMPVSYGSEQWSWICGCDWRTPIVADRKSARQALDEHQGATPPDPSRTGAPTP